MPVVPGPADDIASKFNELLRRVENLEHGSLQSAVVDKGGITVKNGGTIVAETPNNTSVFRAGALPAVYNRIDGSPQQGVILTREVGYPALILADLSPTTDPTNQALQWQDRHPNIVFADDTNGGVGIARPYMSMGQWVDNVPSGSTSSPTTSATFVAQQVAHVYRTQPKIVGIAIVNSTSAGTTGEIQLADYAGTQIGSTVAVPPNAVSYVVFGPFAWPSWSFLDNGILYLSARRTGGTGSIGVRGISLWGTQS